MCMANRMRGGGIAMAIQLVCPICASKIAAPDKASGKRVKCPRCRSRFEMAGNVAVANNRQAYAIGAALLGIVLFCALMMWLAQ
jgi:hypothetical protein